MPQFTNVFPLRFICTLVKELHEKILLFFPDSLFFPDFYYRRRWQAAEGVGLHCRWSNPRGKSSRWQYHQHQALLQQQDPNQHQRRRSHSPMEVPSPSFLLMWRVDATEMLSARKATLKLQFIQRSSSSLSRCSSEYLTEWIYTLRNKFHVIKHQWLYETFFVSRDRMCRPEDFLSKRWFHTGAESTDTSLEFENHTSRHKNSSHQSDCTRRLYTFYRTSKWMLCHRLLQCTLIQNT